MRRRGTEKMRSTFSRDWKASRQPRKQRKYLKNAPLHIRQRLIHATMSKELRKKFGKRSVGVRKGDKVKVMRGEFVGKVGKVNLVDRKRQGVYIDGIERNRRDGAKAFVRIHSSNVMVMEFSSEDKARQKGLKRK